MIKALESYTKPYLDGCVPPGAVNWQDGDNNVNFKEPDLLHGAQSVAVDPGFGV